MVETRWGDQIGDAAPFGKEVDKGFEALFCFT
jgi:hypothetical protein